MPLTATKKAAKNLSSRVRHACDEVRDEWTHRERRQRQIAADRMQSRLASVLGLRQEPVRVPR